ncbi:hypothetical protein AAY473_028083, partial [Plecturocebus cupreus]
MGFHHVDQASLELLTSGHPPASASQSARIAGMSRCAQPLLCFISTRPISVEPAAGDNGTEKKAKTEDTDETKSNNSEARAIPLVKAIITTPHPSIRSSILTEVENGFHLTCGFNSPYFMLIFKEKEDSSRQWHPQQEREHETEYRYQESEECWEENDLCSTAAKFPPKELENAAGLFVSLKEAMLSQGEIHNAMNHK